MGERLNCKVLEHRQIFGHAQPVVLGAQGELAQQLKDYGGRWSARDEALVFPSWTTLETVFQAILHAPPSVVARPQMPEM